MLRYWEQEFTQLKPVKRRGNRRYYQHHEVLLIRRIRELLYEHGFTINGARNRLEEPAGVPARARTGRPRTMTVPQPISPANIRKELRHAASAARCSTTDRRFRRPISAQAVPQVPAIIRSSVGA